MAQQAANEYYPTIADAASAYAAAVNEEVADLFAAGADIVQLDEPYLQARRGPARPAPARPRIMSYDPRTRTNHLPLWSQVMICGPRPRLVA
jgi:methionine synthase II (cobalamin-independent)